MVLSAERQRLREAIETQSHAKKTLDEAQVAAANARERWSAANQKAGAIARQIDAAEEEGSPSSDALISSLATGSDVATLQKPIDELRIALKNAELESAKWRHAIDLAEQVIESRRDAVERAQFYADLAARRVVGAEIDAAAMLCAAEGLRNELLDHQAKLAALASSMEHGDEQRRAVDNFVNDVGWLVDAPWRNRPAGRQVKDAFTALKADASAKMN